MNIYTAIRIEEGSCNSCQDRKPKTVNVIQLNTISIRLCDSCKKKLIALWEKN